MRDGGVLITDEKVFCEIFGEYYVALCMFAERFVGRSGSASDIVQECFTALWQQRTGFGDRRSVKAFLYTAVRNRAVNELAHIRTVREYESAVTARPESEGFFHDHVIEQELYRIVTAEIARLPEQCRRVMMLAVQGYKTAEIAEKLNMAEGTVQTHKKLAYRKLRGRLNVDLLTTSLYFIFA